MKKALQVLVVLLVMSLSVSLAQQRLYVQGNSNANLDFTGSTSFSVFAAAGLTNVAGPLGVRGGVGLTFGNNFSQFRLGADALFVFGTSRSERDPEFYAGGGLRLVAGGGGTSFGLNGVLGAEFPVNPRLSITVEFVPILFFGSGTTFGGDISAGFRIYW